MRGVIPSVLRSGRAGILAGALGLAGMGSAAGQQAVPNPHGALPEGLDCSACHTAQGWRTLRDPLGFQHGARTGQALLGSHARTPCASCHLDLRFDGPDIALSDCASCHLDIHQGRMIQGCIDCHTPTSFHDVQGASIHARTSFPLTGAHVQVTCESCHVNDQGGAFSALDTECASCHLPAYESAATVDHVAGGYPTDCTQCHSTLSWGDAPAFDHIGVSDGFELLGAHGQLRCASCHTVPGMEPIFQASDQNDCVACHSLDYDRKHGGSGVPTTCLSCHSVDSWDASDFDHALVGFQLLGRHADLGCSRCHTENQAGLKFTTPTGQNDCVACHQSDYDKEHAGSGFPTTCLTCHNLNDWDAKGFNHASTAFPLEGAHTAQNCADCHGAPAHLSAAFQSSQSCAACHQTDYDTQHAGSGFPSTCLSCHTQTSWTFDHTTLVGGFSLDGPHVSATCASCHILPTMGLNFPVPADPGDCLACHQTDYAWGHGATGYPTDCAACHTVNAWKPSTFDHDAQYFPIYSGKHRQEWANCTDCHTSPSDLTVFSCLTCHEHRQSDMDDKHKGRQGYTYTSGACLSCHPTGRKD
ncbi:MAG TPA: hypothetical protein VLA36_06795 [Longimicrobiales bacterium]|nr:hypothetical protein [Longimicrobiales bacterium]